MSFVVLYDANVLYPSTLRDLLIRIGQSGLVQAKWTDQILDEVFRSLISQRPDLDTQKLQRTRILMIRAIRDCLVTGYDPLIEAVQLPDPEDRHVLAAAIKARAKVIVTNNVKHSPARNLDEWGLAAQSADTFIMGQVATSPAVVSRAVQRIADSRERPPATFADILSMLERDGLVESADALRSGLRRL